MFFAVCERRMVLLDGAVNVAALQSLVGRMLDRVDECFMGTVGSKSYAQWFEEEGRCVHLVSEGSLEVD